ASTPCHDPAAYASAMRTSPSHWSSRTGRPAMVQANASVRARPWASVCCPVARCHQRSVSLTAWIVASAPKTAPAASGTTREGLTAARGGPNAPIARRARVERVRGVCREVRSARGRDRRDRRDGEREERARGDDDRPRQRHGGERAPAEDGRDPRGEERRHHDARERDLALDREPEERE